ncbi:MAG: 4-hydroxythreonine-4-phosphate dehydrogenase PdxA [Actinobacteria bacterium]|jgi:4-hydroxythreonine-4-phosphate dehydrogenase|nr:4-hydroxythreonine-4-phosphate dehydrogenase PdxA [Actinomycetota bacterium]
MTVGDPRGIGPEIVAKALADPRVVERCDITVVGPEGTGVPVGEPVERWVPEGGAAFAGRLSGLSIVRVVDLAVAGVVQGIVTAPIDKAALHAGGYNFPGHTEMLGMLTGSRVAMMLASDKLRVVLATTHLPLRRVAEELSAKSITEAARITRAGLQQWFGIAEPRIALCALNPHAGDGGRFGNEDQDLLAPAAREAGIAGPFPADTVFVRAMRGEFDAVIAPYHDVGMTAIKVASFGSAVNITLGLPFPRTSPDHGTALDIAGQNRADPSSLIAATLLCASIAARVQSRGGRPSFGDRQTETRSGVHPSSAP